MTDCEPHVVFITAGSEDEAAKIGRTLVEERLAACANIVPRIRSIYRWQGKIEDEPEVLMLLKTTRARLQALIRRASELHGYQVPGIVALRIGEGHAPYLEWIQENAGGSSSASARSSPRADGVEAEPA